MEVLKAIGYIFFGLVGLSVIFGAILAFSLGLAWLAEFHRDILVFGLGAFCGGFVVALIDQSELNHTG